MLKLKELGKKQVISKTWLVFTFKPVTVVNGLSNSLCGQSVRKRTGVKKEERDE